MGDSTFEQSDWGAGIYRGRRAPPGTVFDAVNVLVDDEGQMFKRGGGTYMDSSAFDPMRNLEAAYYPAVNAARLTFFGLTTLPSGRLWAAPTVGTGIIPNVIRTNMPTTPIPGRPASIGGVSVFPIGPDGKMLLYGGTLRALGGYQTSASTGLTASGAANTTILTVSAGPSLAGIASVGMIVRQLATGLVNVIQSVDSATQLTVSTPWPDGGVSGEFGLYGAVDTRDTSQIAAASVFPFPVMGAETFVASAGAGSPRLLVGFANRLYESDPGDGFRAAAWDVNRYHELPSNAEIVGLEGAGDHVLVFTTAGTWIIDNLSLDVVDDNGNVQQQVQLLSGDMVLWGDRGIGAWTRNVIVPARDDIYLISADGGIDTISRAIRPLYRSYVAAGYVPGRAAVHRGHYFLPIMGRGASTDTAIDLLVCRLDRPFDSAAGLLRPWTRWSGHGAGMFFATVSSSTAASRLVAVSRPDAIVGKRLIDLTGALNQTGPATDANATTPTFTVESTDDDLGAGIRPNTVEKVRYVYETTGGTPVVSVSSAVGPEGATYTAATLKRGGGASNGTDYSAWRVGRKAERMRFRFECASQVTSLILRRREVIVRQSGQS
jgi:hypothetical protein